MSEMADRIHPAVDGYTMAADNYVRGRPDYSPAVSDWLHADLGIHAKSAV